MENPTVKKKKGAAGLVIVLALLLAMAAGGWWFLSHYALYRGQVVPRDTTLVDLRGQELAEGDLEKARELFPDAHIVRDVTIGGVTFSSDDRDIVTGDFTAADVGAFAAFDGLESADVTAVSDVAAALALRQALPDTRVYWTVPLGRETFDGDAEEITVSGVTGAELADALERLPYIHTVTVTDDCLSPAEQKALAERYPDAAFRWAVTLAGVRFDQGAEVLSFEGRPLTADDLEQIGEYLPLLDAAAELRFAGTGLSDGELMAFADDHPEVSVVWDTSLFGVDFSTDAEELCFDDIPLTVEDAARIEAMVPYMHNLTRVSMQRCGIDNDSMEAIYRRHIDSDGVKFVWMVQVYCYGVRTDQTWYTIYNCEYRWNSTIDHAENLKYCHDMIAIDLGHMHTYGDTYFFTQMPHLRYLIISNAAYDAIPELASLKELEWLEVHQTSFQDLSPLLECKNLKHLNIVYKKVRSEEARRTDVDILKQMTWLKRLWIGGNMYLPDQVEELRQALPNTEIHVVTGPLTLEGGWRKDKAYFEMRDAMHMYYMTDDGHTVSVNPYTGERSQYEWTNPFH